jgi:hypothetical protein
VEGTVPEDHHPVVQIAEARAMHANAAASYRVRLNDGMFTYSSCCFPRELEQQVTDDGLVDCNAVIRILRYTRTPTNGKTMLAIQEYEVISTNEPIIGHPQSHSGKAEDFRGIQNLPPLGTSSNGAQRSVKRPGSPQANPPAKRFSSAVSNLTPINMITPYVNKWRICGVVSGKEEMREIKTARGAMKVFSFVVTDQNGDSIKISAFGTEAEKFSPLVSNDQAFYVSGSSGSSIRNANKRFNNTGHDYEITLNRDSEV